MNNEWVNNQQIKSIIKAWEHVWNSNPSRHFWTHSIAPFLNRVSKMATVHVCCVISEHQKPLNKNYNVHILCLLLHINRKIATLFPSGNRIKYILKISEKNNRCYRNNSIYNYTYSWHQRTEVFGHHISIDRSLAAIRVNSCIPVKKLYGRLHSVCMDF